MNQDKSKLLLERVAELYDNDLSQAHCKTVLDVEQFILDIQEIIIDYSDDPDNAYIKIKRML